MTITTYIFPLDSELARSERSGKLIDAEKIVLEKVHIYLNLKIDLEMVPYLV